MDGDGHVHIVHGQVTLVPRFPCLQPGGQGKGQVAGVLQGVGVPGGTDPALAVAVQDIQLAVAAIHAQLTGIGFQDLAQLGGSVLLAVDLGGQVTAQLLVQKDLGDLGIEVLQIKGTDGVDEKGAYHRHQTNDEQHHDHHQLHVDAAHGSGSLFHGALHGGLGRGPGALAAHPEKK